MLLTKRAFAFALFAYIVTFIFALPASIVFGYDPSLGAIPPTSYCVAIIAFSTLISAVASWLYFTYKKPKIKASVREGFKFGVTLMALGLVLDMILFLPFVMSSEGSQYLADSYSQLYIYFVFLGVLAGASGVGYYLSKHSKS